MLTDTWQTEKQLASAVNLKVACSLHNLLEILVPQPCMAFWMFLSFSFADCSFLSQRLCLVCCLGMGGGADDAGSLQEWSFNVITCIVTHLCTQGELCIAAQLLLLIDLKFALNSTINVYYQSMGKKDVKVVRSLRLDSMNTCSTPPVQMFFFCLINLHGSSIIYDAISI